MMTESQEDRDAIWRMVRDFNEACVRGAGFDHMASAIDEDVVFIPPGFSGRIQGREKLR